MVRIRLRRHGAKGHPSYRIVVADQRFARNGRYIEQIGTYDPLPNPPNIKVDREKALSWIGKGAQPSDSVRQIFGSVGILPKIESIATPNSNAGPNGG